MWFDLLVVASILASLLGWNFGFYLRRRYRQRWQREQQKNWLAERNK